MPVDRYGITPYGYSGLGYGVARGVGRLIGQRYRGPSAPTRTMVKRKKKPLRGYRNSFAARVRNLGSYKHNTQSDATVTSALTHNSIYTTSLTTKIDAGDGIGQRDGDAIFINAVKIQGAVHSAAAVTGANMIRILILWSGEEYNVTASTSGLTTSEIFHAGASALVSNGMINSKACTVIYDETVDINSLLTTTAECKTIYASVPINQKFNYQAGASVYGKIKNLYLVVIGSIVGGSGSVGNFLLNTDVIFQNS